MSGNNAQRAESLGCKKYRIWDTGLGRHRYGLVLFLYPSLSCTLLLPGDRTHSMCFMSAPEFYNVLKENIPPASQANSISFRQCNDC